MNNIQKKLSFDLCVNSLNLLNSLKKIQNEFFIFKDFRNNELMFYSKFNKLWVAKCFLIENIYLIAHTVEIICFNNMKIQFKIKNKILTGFIDQDLIITNNSSVVFL